MSINQTVRRIHEQQQQERRQRTRRRNDKNNGSSTFIKQLFFVVAISLKCISFSTVENVMAFTAITTTIGSNNRIHYQFIRRILTSPKKQQQQQQYSRLFSTKKKTIDDDDIIAGTTKSKTDENDEYSKAIEEFLTATTSSLSASSSNDKNNFIGFAISGPPKPTFKKSKSMEQVEKEKEDLRGCIRLVTGRLIQLKNKKKKKEKEEIVLQVTFKYHGATDVAKNWQLNSNEIEDNLKKIFQEKEEEDSFQSEWGHVGNTNGMRSAILETTLGSWNLELQPPPQNVKKKKSKKKKKYPSCTFVPNKNSTDKNNQNEQPTIASHDRTKNVPIQTSSLYLQKLGLIDSQNKPKKNKSSKLRQCFKFVEIVSKLIEPYVLSSSSSSGGKKEGNIKINTMDMGCGRGYLTFSLHSYLMEKYGSTNNNVKICTKGVDVRPKLVREMNDIVHDLSSNKSNNEDDKTFEALKFVEGTIESALTDCNNKKHNKIHKDENHHDIKEKNNEQKTIDILIALHACDTATDDALYYGIRSSSSIIVVAPCCHKEIRRQLSSFSTTTSHPYGSILRHNIYAERLAEMITDSLRALMLELYGYNVQVFEFVGGEHTAKNVMIVATKRSKKRSGKEVENIRRKMVELAKLHGVTKQRLATMWMGESLLSTDGDTVVEKVEEENTVVNEGQEGIESSARMEGRKTAKRRKAVTFKAGSMPPLDV